MPASALPVLLSFLSLLLLSHLPRVVAPAASSVRYGSICADFIKNTPLIQHSPLKLSQGAVQEQVKYVLDFGKGWTQEQQFSFEHYMDIVRVYPTDVNHEISVKGGELRGEHHLHHVQFRFATMNREGSEHKLEGVNTAIEAQFIMRHRLSLSADVIEKVVVLSTLFAAPPGATGAAADKNAAPRNLAMSKDGLFRHFIPLVNNDTTTPSKREASFVLNNWLPETRTFYKYEGMTTYLGCDTGATWIVFDNPVQIQDGDFNVFNNFRAQDGGPIINTLVVQNLTIGKLFYKSAEVQKRRVVGPPDETVLLREPEEGVAAAVCSLALLVAAVGLVLD